MPTKFTLTIDSFETITELPDIWNANECLQLLEALEYEGAKDIAPSELKDYAIMALQDLEIDGAAQALLDFVFADKLSKGKKQNIAEDMQREPLWEEYPDLSYHEPIFKIQHIFNLAFQQTPKPEANRIEATIAPTDQTGAARLARILTTQKPEPFIVRCLAAALPESSILNRLFEDPIAGGTFTEAEHIVWQIQSELGPRDDKGRQAYKLTLFSPQRWSNDLEDAPETLCEPFLDKEETEQ